MMTMTPRSTLWIVLVALATGPLAAQRPSAPGGNSGLWLGGGAGLGWARVECRICDANRGHSLSAYVHVGFPLSTRIVFGGEVEAWRQNARPDQNRLASELMIAYNAVMFWYPSQRYPYYLKSGFGLVTYRIHDDTDRLTSSALGPQIGAGWEIPVASHFAIVPYANFLFASTGAGVKLNGQPVLDKASLELFQFGVGISRR
jgi:hypothetical protein